jgi:polar amino acid transport system substrate-binding protein
MVEGGFQFTGVAVAVPKGRPEALTDATAFLEKAKKSGAVRQAFERAGLAHLDVAP